MNKHGWKVQDRSNQLRGSIWERCRQAIISQHLPLLEEVCTDLAKGKGGALVVSTPQGLGTTSLALLTMLLSRHWHLLCTPLFGWFFCEGHLLRCLHGSAPNMAPTKAVVNAHAFGKSKAI